MNCFLCYRNIVDFYENATNIANNWIKRDELNADFMSSFGKAITQCIGLRFIPVSLALNNPIALVVFFFRFLFYCVQIAEQQLDNLNVDMDPVIILKYMALPNSGLQIKNRKWLKIPVPMSFIGMIFSYKISYAIPFDKNL